VRLFCTFLLALGLTACSGNGSQQNSARQSDTDAQAALTPRPNYSEIEGDKYLYIGALSEDDEKAGKRVPDVTTFRFGGKKNDLYILEALDGDGSVAGTVECKNPCKIVTLRYGPLVERVGNTEDSIMGAALQDAFNGFLEPKVK